MAPTAQSSSSSPETVCVIDASGPLGAALVHRLLQRGYIVHAALHHHPPLQDDELVQSLVNKNKNKRLKVFEADPLDYHSIMAVLRGCSALFYSFEPLPDHPTYDEFMGEVEVRAAHNVVEACAQTDSIQKVVFTSSATAVIWRNQEKHFTEEEEDNIDERHWSDTNLCKKHKLWHALSKTLAEKTAWSLAMDRGLNMVSVNCGLVITPDLTIHHPYLKGAAEMFEDGVFVTVDLRFLVDAHISIFQDPSSYGRYLCFNRVISSTIDAHKLATMLLPSSSHHRSQDHQTTHHQQRITNNKLRNLMIRSDTNDLLAQLSVN